MNKFEIVRRPSDLAPYLYAHKVHPHSVYDFTFENRYIVYHYSRPSYTSCAYVYAVVDNCTHRTYQMFTNGSLIQPSEYSSLISAALFTVNQNGDRRYAAHRAA